MNEYRFFPPYANFKKVLQNCPEIALLYIALWKIKLDKPTVRVRRQDVQRRFYISPTLFKNQIAALKRIDLLSVEETKDLFVIDFEPQNE